MPAGTKKAVQVRSSKPEKPCSFTVGTSGSAGERCALVTAIARTLPPFTCDTAGGIEVLRDLRVSGDRGAHRLRRLVGHMRDVDRSPAVLMRSMERCVVVPMPDDA